MLVWPDRDQVREAAREWARAAAAGRGDVVRLGCFGSYARGDAGVGSDLDLVAVLRHSDVPFVQRSADWPVERLPVAADLLVYTEEEWERLLASDTRFARTLRDEIVWIWPDAGEER